MMRAAVLIWILAAEASAAGVAPPAKVEANDGSTDEAKRLYRQAELEYKLGRFDEALRLFSSAYETKAIPAFLFNIGQCHFNLKNYERAIFFYEGYLRDLPAATNRLTVDSQIALARRELAKQQRLARKSGVKNETPPEAAPVVAAAPTPLPPRQVTPAPVVEPSPASAPMPQAEVKAPVYKKWWLWAIVSVVVASGAATAVAIVLTQPKAAPAVPTVNWRN